MKQERKTLRAKEIAELYGISLTTVWNYSKDGLLTPIKISHKVTVFNADEVVNLFLGKSI